MVPLTYAHNTSGWFILKFWQNYKKQVGNISWGFLAKAVVCNFLVFKLNYPTHNL